MQTNILPKGFVANGLHCGVKKKRKDLALFYSKEKCKIAALFTTNSAKAAPVLVAIEQLKKAKHIRGIVVNSGNANCMTGKRGIRDAKKMTSYTAELLGVPAEEILVSSTGIIGVFMPMKPIISALPTLVQGLSSEGFLDASDAIMTTDRFRKIVSRKFNVGGRKVTMTGVAKGAGMINPKMATMLCYIFTDASISRELLEKALDESTAQSFNAITVDGDMSTNDTVMLLANGASGNKVIKTPGADFDCFRKNLNEIAVELAKMIVMDGEGATKLIEVNVTGAYDENEAQTAAKAVAGSLLVKCAVLGGDPNWGRVASSVGSSGVKFDPGKFEIMLDGVTFFKDGKAARVNRKTTPVFKGKQVNITVNLHAGRAEGVCYSCDISNKYIKLNSYYTT